MPFNAEAYDLKCRQMSNEALIARRSHYVRQLAGSSTATALHTAAGAVTAGLSWLMVPYDAARIRNARRKRRILERHAVERGLAVKTKKGDLLVPMALSVTFGAVAIEGAEVCADVLVGSTGGSSSSAAAATAAHGVVKGVAHVGLDAGVAAAEHAQAKQGKIEVDERLIRGSGRGGSMSEESKKK
ncbi:hypothetical protein COL5a_007770 [Colletotrichum fioriniae]|uniref:uncharacterized protein n=1 Tax=Colletotrichum fioriniae TaxID=710243 RepID=UPI0023019D6F|nr:uncharacterized protein COL516b_010119 [Colletotrichum fioriniae]KAJ0298196.1 hypothetical protein COL516b_010119 [Colletotrichum fioriniae]KAJ0324506.1 hypothetical protein COL5a_007770 [Colletotrichum fioriniae]KAJ3939363.1 hypothetical protein N0V96_010811 [Colletotrichum fioriniae]